jgi:hypothetical protein
MLWPSSTAEGELETVNVGDGCVAASLARLLSSRAGAVACPLNPENGLDAATAKRSSSMAQTLTATARGLKLFLSVIFVKAGEEMISNF